MKRLRRDLVVAIVALLALVPMWSVVLGRPTPAQAQASGTITIVLTGDVSPPTNEASGNDHSVAELITRLDPWGVCINGDNQYEYGHPAMFAATTGFEGSHGRLFKDKILCSAPGNHDAADPGPGSPGWYNYFKPNLDNLPCLNEPVPCRPDLGYYILDLPVSPGASELGWYIVVLDSNCQRQGGGTGDTQTESCAANGRMATWMRAAIQRRHIGPTGNATSGRKCGMMLWHHERWGTGFFADDPSTQHLWNIGNDWHVDIASAGHTHSLARLGPMTPTGTVSASGSGIRQLTAGAGGRSLTANRVEPARLGTRERYNSHYGVILLSLTSTPSAAGWLGGSWTSSMHFVGRTGTAPATAGCWP